MNKKFTLKEMIFSAVFAAIIAVLSQVAFPVFAVPVTLQTFAVALCGYVIGTKCAAVATVVYAALGAVGVPVFANFKGGFQALIGPTGGFIFGFIAMAVLCGINFKNIFARIGFGMLGLAACHICGFIQYALVAGIDFGESFMLVSFPFLLKDAISVIIAFAISVPIKKALKKSGLMA